MKTLLVFLSMLSLSFTYGQNEALDTLLDIGGYNMHFNILEGEGTPILFESGAGNDGSVWKAIAMDVHDVTSATVICYDRSGFGTSELNPNHTKDADFGIDNGMLELEEGLKRLGYFDSLILVSHSYGGFYTTLFSQRNSDKVLYNVRIDANLAGQYTEDVLIKAEQDNDVNEMKDENLGLYYLGVNFANTVRRMWKVEYPKSVPAIDIVSPIQRHQTDDEWQLVTSTHEDFVKEESNRIGMIAYGCGHYIFKDNPGLVLNAIVKAYVSTLSNDDIRLAVLSRSLDKSMELFIRDKRNESE